MPSTDAANERLTFRILGPEDAAILQHVAHDVFDNAVDQELAAEFLNDARHHLAVALDRDTVVGMASAVDYVHPDKPRELWINEVGLPPAYPRKGVGRQLLPELFARGREPGCREAWVGAGHDNGAARALYVGHNGREEPFVLYSFRIGDPV